MIKRNTYFIALGVLSLNLGLAQQKEAKKADKDFKGYAYAAAIDSYESLVERGLSDDEIYRNLGYAHYNNANYQEAAKWFGKLLDQEGTSGTADDLYAYAQSLKSSGDYEAAEAWNLKFMEANGSDNRALKRSENPEYLEEIAERSGRYTIENLSINSAASDFGPALYGDGLVFASARDTGRVAKRVHKWNNQPFLNLYTARKNEEGFGTVEKLATALNKRTHESSAVFTKDGKTAYFTRNNSQNGRFKRDEQGVSRLKIYRAQLVEGVWDNITPLPFNNDAYSVAHPSLNADETKLFFASDMEGSLGQSDIYMVDLLPDGGYGEPKNLGRTINTEARESFPHITAEGVLYFASDGHPGLGGLDVFAVDLMDEDYMTAVNVGRPINGPQDDFGYILNGTTDTGYFTSNRSGGKGNDDIYRFVQTAPLDLRCTTEIAGTVRNESDATPLADATIVLMDANGEAMAETRSGADGTYTLEGDCSSGSYTLVATKTDYKDGEKILMTVERKGVSNADLSLAKALPKAAVGSDLVAHLNIAPVHFDLDKAAIRTDAAQTIEKVLAYLEAYPETRIEIQSHTDIRGSMGYNAKLSERRAQNTMAYLIDKGIAPERLSAKGFGESKLINSCTSSAVCTDAEHEANRRSEFIVLP